ncbi:dienelactone hydrolase family protein [Roseateles saccharophilus]|uniref:Carboxymethylenebutenolidase n=1 Tax=Roseateles saccharophilus TaxID=304 RepID=A0A4R3V565_ROSSA|nr:dienelactone hydrolase family protein [Roseateles saccharophilus]MDG0831425.1 carboxymethylenebutenolidase [Roseateles saccharophilus]TCU98691.1 carboxymethylenebutenolidase [Roseateles saccharophilus]
MPKVETGRFAAAVLPVTAQTIRTDGMGLEAGPVSIPVDGFQMPAYRAAPAGGRNLPVVLVACEIFGLHEHIADVCRRLARQGYLAIAPGLFARHGDAGAYTDIPRLIAEVVGKAADEQVNADLDATVAWAGTQGGDTGRLGITGFCWGGRTAWSYAAHSAAVKAAVAWYGPVARSYHAGDATVIERAARIQAPVLGLYGAADGGIPVDTLAQLEAALKAAGNTACEFVVYPDTPHAFFADYRPSYRKPQADDGWARCLAWLRRNGVA